MVAVQGFAEVGIMEFWCTSAVDAMSLKVQLLWAVATALPDTVAFAGPSVRRLSQTIYLWVQAFSANSRLMHSLQSTDLIWTLRRDSHQMHVI